MREIDHLAVGSTAEEAMVNALRKLPTSKTLVNFIPDYELEDALPLEAAMDAANLQVDTTGIMFKP